MVLVSWSGYFRNLMDVGLFEEVEVRLRYSPLHHHIFRCTTSPAPLSYINRTTISHTAIPPQHNKPRCATTRSITKCLPAFHAMKLCEKFHFLIWKKNRMTLSKDRQQGMRKAGQKVGSFLCRSVLLTHRVARMGMLFYLS